MNSLNIVTQLKELSANPENRSAIVKDQGCLPGLVLFLDNTDDRVVTTALEAMQYLAEDLDNKVIMYKELGLLYSLRKIAQDEKKSAIMRELAHSVDNMINPEFAEKRMTRSNAKKLVSSPTVNKTSSASAGGGSGKKAKNSSSHSFFVGGVCNRKAKLLTVLIKGLDDAHCRKIAEQALIKLRGIISFTFDMVKSRVYVRSRTELDPARVCEAIEKTKIMTAQHVMKNEDGEEIFVSYSQGKENKGKNEVPDYLPEDNEDVFPETAEKNALTRKDHKKDKDGWFSSVGNYLATNLYW
eukprot:Nk52_evm11s2485 gene=Nk52_evmTU11s2485